jgi:hypothetical protein
MKDRNKKNKHHWAVKSNRPLMVVVKLNLDVTKDVAN